MNETTRQCPQCAAPLPANAPQGLCPQCLLKAAAAPPGVPGDIIDIGDPAEVAKALPQFEIIELLGQGGMGVVYKARQRALDRVVALKILPPADALSPDFIARFTREAQSLAKLTHPNIVGIYDFGECGGLYFFSMEFVDGVNLRALLAEKKVTAGQALAIVPCICDALAYAHEEGVVHRDIKPENILIDKKGRVKIADFGLAKLLRRESLDLTLTATGVMLGTVRYMAPEQMEKPETVDHRADIYSLGVVFYEMLTGEVPMGRFAPPSEKVQVDVRFDEIVLRSLEHDVERRYQHASEVKTDVENVTQPVPAVQKAGTPAMPPREETPGRAWMIFRFVTLLAALAGAALVAAPWQGFEIRGAFTQGNRVQWFLSPGYETGLGIWVAIVFLMAFVTTLAGFKTKRVIVPVVALIAAIAAAVLLAKYGYNPPRVEHEEVREVTKKISDVQIFGITTAWSRVTTFVKLGRMEYWQVLLPAFWVSVVCALLTIIASTLDCVLPRRVAAGGTTAPPEKAVRAPGETLVLLGGVSVLAALGLGLWEARAKLPGPFPEAVGMAITLATHGLFVGAAGLLMRRLRARMFVLGCLVLAGLCLPVVIAVNVIMEIGRIPLWPVAIPLWLAIPACVWAICVLFREDVREASIAALRPASAGTLPTANTGRPRLSRCAFFGTIWAGFGLLTVVPVLYFIALNRVWNGTALPTDIIHSTPPWEFTAFMGALLAIGSGAPIGSPILGAVSIGHIRRSGGKVFGLPAAAVSLLACPLALLAAGTFIVTHVIQIALWTQVHTGYEYRAGGVTNVIAPPAASYPGALFMIPDSLVTLGVAFFVGRAAWRKISGVVPQQAIGPRLSRGAVIGMVWAFFGLLGLLPLQYFTRSNEGPWIGGQASLVQLNFVTGVLLAIGAGAPIGSTIFGSVAIGNIKRSGGQLYGLPLAAISALFYPLLLLGAGVFAVLLLAYRAVTIDWIWTPAANGRPPELAYVHFWNGFALCATLAGLTASFFAGRAAWRKISGVVPQPKAPRPPGAWTPLEITAVATTALAFVTGGVNAIFDLAQNRSPMHGATTAAIIAAAACTAALMIAQQFRPSTRAALPGLHFTVLAACTGSLPWSWIFGDITGWNFWHGAAFAALNFVLALVLLITSGGRGATWRGIATLLAGIAGLALILWWNAVPVGLIGDRGGFLFDSSGPMTINRKPVLAGAWIAIALAVLTAIAGALQLRAAAVARTRQ